MENSLKWILFFFFLTAGTWAACASSSVLTPIINRRWRQTVLQRCIRVNSACGTVFGLPQVRGGKSFPLTRKEGMTHACDVMETGSPLTSVKAMVLVSCAIGVSSQCNGELESCSHGLCSDECENSNASGSGVEIIVIIMSISVALIIGLAIVLVYVCFKQGPWSQSVDAPSNESTTCDSSTGVEIPDYLMRRRFSSLSMTAGPPPYFSLFSFNLNGIGEMQSTVVGENVGTETSNEQPPEYGILFGNSPPPYEHVVKISQLLKPLETGTTVITTAG